MVLDHLIQALRSFEKNKVHSLINILGLSLGLTASMLVFLFVRDELSFDTFHANTERLYRLNKIDTQVDGSTSLTSESSGLMGPAMVDELPEVEKVVRYQPWYDDILLSYKDNNVLTKEQELVFADSTFFEVFSFTLQRGDPKKVLTRPSTMVLTEKTAKALFGNEDAIGKVVKGMHGIDFEITGIAADPPRNSHIQFAGIMSWSTTVPQVGPLEFDFLNNWIAQALCTYVLLKEGSNQKNVEAKFGKFMMDHLPERAGQYALYLQPFNEIYLRSQNIEALRMAKIGNEEYLVLFSVIAGFILFIACINYINISTSKSTRRGKEVGMRKTLGASRHQLINQFLIESLLITFFAGFIALSLLYFTLPFFNEMAGKTIPLENVQDPTLLFVVAVLIVFVTIASGLYPAFVISSFRPIEILKSAKVKITGNWPRYTLITFQFVVSIVMIAGTLLVYQQIQYVLSKPLGFEKEHVLVVNITDEMAPKADVFQEEVRALNNVLSTSLCRTALGKGIPGTYVIPEGFAANEVEIRMFRVDYQFQETYGFEMVKGRYFNSNVASDSNAFIINEALMKRLSWSDPIGKTIRFAEDQPAYPVIGVVKDFHFKSLYEQVEPLLMYISNVNRANLSIRFTGNPSSLLTSLESKWKRFESRYPFQYYFVDKQFAKNYENEQRLLQSVVTFAALSIVIACLGLYGLVSYTVEQRTKEFGIRKVLGASFTSLNMLVNKKFIFMVLIAACIAIPVVLPLFNKWLQKFAFRVRIGPEVFISSILITLIITMITVSIHALKVARMNPASSLRHE